MEALLAQVSNRARKEFLTREWLVKIFFARGGGEHGGAAGASARVPLIPHRKYSFIGRRCACSHNLAGFVPEARNTTEELFEEDLIPINNIYTEEPAASLNPKLAGFFRQPEILLKSRQLP